MTTSFGKGSSSGKARIGVVGGTGYVGSELVRWLLDHPSVEIAMVCARSSAGQKLGDVVPQLTGLTDLVVQELSIEDLAGCDAVVFATPHGAAKDVAPDLVHAGARRILDMSSDHRADPSWVYGLAEWNAAAIAEARKIAVAGCFATAVELAVAPFAVAGLLAGDVYVSAATGSTGSGVTPSPGTHHPERFANMKAYKVLKHQHLPEIGRILGELAGQAPKVHFVPVSAPVDRGIFATVFAPLKPGADVRALFEASYADTPLVRLRAETPELRAVRGSAFADVSVHQDGDTAVILVAIDNLGKGAATQTVQCLNLSLGLPVDTGLRRAGCTP